MFFVFVLGKNIYALDIKTVNASIKKIENGHLSISESKPSTLPREASGGSGNGINAYRFLSAGFKEKLYAFERKNLVEGKDINMSIWTTTDSGITWSQESKATCPLDNSNGPCDIVSSMIFDDELVVIYANKTKYAISKSADGITWATGEELELDSSMANKKLLYYSGKPADLSDSKDGKKKYLICYETDEAPAKDGDKEHLSVAACSESDDDGASWTIRSYLRVEKEVTNLSDLDQIYFLKENAYFIVSVGSKKNVIFGCKPWESPTKSGQEMHCEEAKDDSQPETFPMLAVNSDNDSALLIMKTPEAYIMAHLTDDHAFAETLLEIKGAKAKRPKRDLRSAVAAQADKGEALKKATEVDGSKPIIFHVMFVDISRFSVMYEYEEKIYNIIAEIKEKKRGCLFIKEAEKKKAKDESTDAYTKTISYKDLESETEKECPLDNFEPEGEEEYVNFFVKVPEQVDFENSENCFQHTLIEEDKAEFSKHKRPIIHIKNVVSFDGESDNKMKEIEFVYLASLHKLMKYEQTVSCTSKSFNFKISYTFSNDTNMVKTVAFKTLVKDFTVEENRLSLADYSWNISDPETAIGSYVIESKDYIKRFQVYVDLLNNTPNAATDYNNFKTSFPTEMNQMISVAADETTKDYAGVDLTNSSKHYEEAESDIKEDKTIPVKVVVPKEGKIVGLICPLENSKSLDELHCFDVVKDLKDNTVKLEELFTTVPFVMLPKIMVYNQKVMAVESLLHLNEDSYNELEKLPDAINFHCVCKMNTHTVTLSFAIGTESSKFEDDDNPIIDEGSGAHSILSSAVVLLVLFNVFSCTGFLN